MTTIADYEVIEQLGDANHGELWLARPPARLGIDDRVVVVKTLVQNATDEEFKRLATELRAFASATSPHLVPLLDAGQHRGRLFYSMPHFADGSLEDRPPLGAGQASAFLADVARGAHALHEVGVVHRDINPRNVLVDADRAFLADLGLARLVDPSLSMTGTGPVGTIAFTEPALLRGQHRGSRASDIWGLGATLHWTLTGHSVFGQLPAAGSLVTVLRHVLTRTPDLSPDLPPSTREVVSRCLAPNESDRYSTALDLANALEKVPAT